MMVRDTTTGGDYEKIIETTIKRSCQMNKLKAEPQIFVGVKPGGGRHRIDWEISEIDNPNIRGLVSCKIQNTSGTAEEKLAYEVINLLHTMETDHRYVHAWIIMGGTGWSPSMKKFIEKELILWIPRMENKISIYTTTDELVTKGISFKR